MEKVSKNVSLLLQLISGCEEKYLTGNPSSCHFCPYSLAPTPCVVCFQLFSYCALLLLALKLLFKVFPLPVTPFPPASAGQPFS